jgi:hypothetical protein
MMSMVQMIMMNEKLCGRIEFAEIFNGAAVKYQGDDVGVLVSGPEGLKASVAEECRRQNFTKPSWSNSTHFHFHSISFNL